ncbi:MAG: DUF547 domain-containing protein [Xanthomonadales bacterium]|nr:DUF547 domain-containing protein [Xanthomonadales bacterium]
MKAWGFCIVLLILVAAPGAFYPVHTYADPANPAEQNMYSNETFVRLVKKYLSDDGDKIDYAAWKDSPEDLQALDQQVALLARVSPASDPDQFPTAATKRSYWINTYNTLVLQAVLEYWPLESVQDVKISVSSRLLPGKGFFYDRKVTVGGKKTNLYKLEKEVLKTQKDPRLHFAFNCASTSCPVLRPWEWTDEQLDQAGREFINNQQNVSVEAGTVMLSSIFKWYKKDFPADVLVYLQQYAEPSLQQELKTAVADKYKIRYETYDWSLNASSHPASDNGLKPHE